MKKTFTFYIFLFLAQSIFSQTIIFSDDFESGTSNWDIIGFWGTTDELAYSGSYSFTESPYDDTYVNGYTEQKSTMVTGVDLTSATDAIVSFTAQIDLETGFDYMYLEASPDGGITWFEVAVFNGEDLFFWEEFSFSIGSFIGYSDVKLRFNFLPDYAYEVDGMYIDDFTITSYDTDISPPLIIYDPLPLFEGTLLENTITATVIDGSGIASTSLFYSVDGASFVEISGLFLSGDEYTYTIPAQPAGSFIDYYIAATDNAPIENTGESTTWKMISGEHIFYDDGSTGVDAFIYLIGEFATEFAAVRIELDDPTQLVSMILQTYTDALTYPNDSLEIHIWSDDGGEPGDDLITPFKIWPESTLDNPYGGTRVDLRDYEDELSGISGDIYIGYTVEGNYVPAIYNGTVIDHSLVASGGFWSDLSGDFHFRAVTTGGILPPLANFTYSGDPIVEFIDASTNIPTSWNWDFGDGGVSTEQNPTYTFNTNGAFNVCLTATNGGGSSEICKIVGINNAILAPAADFNYTLVGSTATFNDISTNVPTSWDWDFGDGNSSSEQNPIHTYEAIGGATVCLSASNIAGFDTECKEIELPVAIEIVSQELWNIYPNPANQSFQIVMPNPAKNYTLSIYNSFGEQTYFHSTSKDEIQVNTKEWTEGIYFIQIEMNQLFYYSSIVISH